MKLYTHYWHKGELLNIYVLDRDVLLYNIELLENLLLPRNSCNYHVDYKVAASEDVKRKVHTITLSQTLATHGKTLQERIESVKVSYLPFLGEFILTTTDGAFTVTRMRRQQA